MVVVKVTGKGALKAINIDPSLMNPDEKEILEDLIVAAMNDARGKGRSGGAGPDGGSHQGLPLPPGLKMF